MICHEIILDKAIDAKALIQQLSKFFNTLANNILVVHEIPTFKVSSDKYLICVMQKLAGDFHQHISVYVKNESFYDLKTSDLAVHICKNQKIKALISDDNVNPYKMFLIDEKGTKKIISLDADALDEDRYVLASQRSLY